MLRHRPGREFLGSRHDQAPVFDDAFHQRFLAQQREALAAMSADHPQRPLLERILADQEYGPRSHFRTETTTTRRPRLDVDIAASTFEVVEPG